MLKLTKIAFLVSALAAGSTFTTGASAAWTGDQLIAREASEGPRGEGGRKGGHCAIESFDQLAREASEGPRGEGGRKGGHCAIDSDEQLARRGADDGQADDRGGRRGGRGADDGQADDRGGRRGGRG